jgi:hypothetical protein
VGKVGPFFEKMRGRKATKVVYKLCKYLAIEVKCNLAWEYKRCVDLVEDA